MSAKSMPNSLSARSLAAVDSCGDYEVVVGARGIGVIRHRGSGETMHSIADPALEAFGLYVRQASLLELAQIGGEPLVIWDVGLGAATNAFEGIKALEGLSKFGREVRLVSFECDLDPIRLVAKNPELFEAARHAGVAAVLSDGEWRRADGAIRWELLVGDFAGRMQGAPLPDIIWYDPFSYKVNHELWSVDLFSRLHRLVYRHPTRLFTYSASTAVRAAMLVGGWFVGYGDATGQKRETTVAVSAAGLAAWPEVRLLGAEWLSRWERSDAARPLGYTGDDYRAVILSHPQFVKG